MIIEENNKMISSKNTYNRRNARDQVLNDTTPMLRGQARIVLRYSLTSATALSDRISAH